MPSKKPIFTIRAEQELFDKISLIAEENGRSANKEIIQLIKQAVQKYEEEHGEISINVNNNSGIIIGENKGTIHM